MLLPRLRQTRPKPGPALTQPSPWADRDPNDPAYGAYVIGLGFIRKPGPAHRLMG
jgi:hypothetical protein